MIHVSIVVENVAVLDLYWHAEVIGMDLQLELGFYVDVSNAALVRLDSHLALM